MINKYYYLVSSLPYLKFDKASPISRDEFSIECKKWVAEKDMAGLSKASILDCEKRPDDIPIITTWKSLDCNLRAELAFARKNKRDNRNEKPGQSAKTVLEERNPLLMEQAFARIRWNLLDSLEAGNFFDLNFLIIYFLKIQILEKLQAFNKEKGEKMFEAMCEVNYE
jgi:hypothetical protein